MKISLQKPVPTSPLVQFAGLHWSWRGIQDGPKKGLRRGRPLIELTITNVETGSIVAARFADSFLLYLFAKLVDEAHQWLRGSVWVQFEPRTTQVSDELEVRFEGVTYQRDRALRMFLRNARAQKGIGCAFTQIDGQELRGISSLLHDASGWLKRQTLADPEMVHPDDEEPTR